MNLLQTLGQELENLIHPTESAVNEPINTAETQQPAEQPSAVGAPGEQSNAGATSAPVAESSPTSSAAASAGEPGNAAAGIPPAGSAIAANTAGEQGNVHASEPTGTSDASGSTGTADGALSTLGTILEAPSIKAAEPALEAWMLEELQRVVAHYNVTAVGGQWIGQGAEAADKVVLKAEQVVDTVATDIKQTLQQAHAILSGIEANARAGFSVPHADARNAMTLLEKLL